MRRLLPLVVFVAVLGFLPSRAATAQSSAPAGVHYKDPGTATVLSVLILGGGQYYTGHTAKGLELMALGYGSLVLGAALVQPAQCADSYCSYTTGPNLTPLWLGLAGYGAAWLDGVLTASSDAEQYNADASRRTALVPFVNRRAGVMQFGLALR